MRNLIFYSVINIVGNLLHLLVSVLQAAIKLVKLPLNALDLLSSYIVEILTEVLWLAVWPLLQLVKMADKRLDRLHLWINKTF